MVVSALKGVMGMIKLTEPESDDFYEDYSDEDPTVSRHLFKISHYKSEQYGDVWVCYTSGTNPDIDFPILTHALFVIREEESFKIARNYIYSNQGGMSTVYGWEEGSGYQDLIFESLGELIEVERYLKPLEFDNGLELYNQEA